MSINSLYDEKLLKGSYYPKVAAYYFKEWKDYSMPVHKHDRVEIMYVLKGKCTIDTTDSKHIMTKGECILLDADSPHSLFVEKDKTCRMLNVEFGFEKVEEVFEGLNNLILNSKAFKYLLADRKPYIIVKDNEEIYDVLKNLIRELDEKNIDVDFVTRSLIYQVFICVGRKLHEISSEESSSSSSYVKKAVRYMNENYTADILVEDVASFVNLHPNYLHRIFKECTGQTPVDYLQNIRIEKAQMLLSYTEIPIIDIASDIGFGSRQYFSYVFKNYTGLSPRQYRKIYSNVQSFFKEN